MNQNKGQGQAFSIHFLIASLFIGGALGFEYGSSWLAISVGVAFVFIGIGDFICLIVWARLKIFSAQSVTDKIESILQRKEQLEDGKKEK